MPSTSPYLRLDDDLSAGNGAGLIVIAAATVLGAILGGLAVYWIVG